MTEGRNRGSLEAEAGGQPGLVGKAGLWKPSPARVAVSAVLTPGGGCGMLKVQKGTAASGWPG